MEREKYHRYMYSVAALWNWILAISFLVLPLMSMDYFTLFGLPIPNTLLWFDCFFGLVFAFGLGFYIISKSTKENHGLIQIAVFEKTWVFLMGLGFFLIGEASIWVIVVVVGDLIFGLLFLEDLIAIRKLK
ncbi:hypothetical protein EU524_01855 [Candidatus Thorarchaeota archaeon]|jgi:hypothetical protein|nr:MAG: hypothetical protein EU524_01855 [Candidatus Thorarchaeota archaeon]